MEPNLSATCPSCQTKIRLGKKPFVGFFFFFVECDAELEVIEINPLSVAEVVEDYEDFDDDATDDYVYVDDDDDYLDDDDFDD